MATTTSAQHLGPPCSRFSLRQSQGVPRVRSAAGPRALRGLRLDDGPPRRRDLPGRLRGPRVARHALGRRRARDGADGPGPRRRAIRSSACASGSAWPGTALGLPAGELADANVPVAEVWGPDVDERIAAGGMPALLDIVRERVRGVEVDPLARAAALGDGRARARAWTCSASAGRERAPAAPPVRRRRRLRAEDARARAALPALPRLGARPATTSRALALGAGYADQAHLTRETRRLAGRTPARAAARARGERRAATAHCAEASRLVADSFKRASHRLPTVRRDDRTGAGVHLGDRAGARAAALRVPVRRGGDPRAVKAALEPTRPPTAATGTRWSPTGAARRASRRTSGPRSRCSRSSARPTRAIVRPHRDAHRARRRRAGRAAEPGALAARAVVGHRDRGHAAGDRAALRAACRGEHAWKARAEAFCWRAIEAIEKTHPYEVESAITFLDAASDRDRAPRQAERLGTLVREQKLVGTQPEGYSPGEIHHPHNFAEAPDSLARAWFSDAEIEASLDHLGPSSASTAAGRSRGRTGCPRSRSSGAGS